VSNPDEDLSGEWEDPADPVQPLPRKPRWDFPKHGACLWPVGDVSDPDFHFCANPIAVGRVYCQDHADLAYMRLLLKKKAS
jgi:GcrA cell cycle regulator